MNISNKKSGAVIIEFVLIVPIFLLLLFAMIEFGWILHVQQIMSSATREGTRIIALQKMSQEETKSYIKNYLNKFNFNIENINIEIIDQDPTCQKNMAEITMVITLPISNISIIGDPFHLFTQNKYVTTKLIMRKEC